MLNHVHVNCAARGCYATITLHEQEESRLRKTEERFYCPAGHSNYFPKQKKVDPELTRARNEASRMQGLVNAYHYGADVCPLGCGWSANRWMRGWVGDWTPRLVRQYLDRVGRDLADHLVRDHGGRVSTIKQIPAKTGEAR